MDIDRQMLSKYAKRLQRLERRPECLITSRGLAKIFDIEKSTSTWLLKQLRTDYGLKRTKVGREYHYDREMLCKAYRRYANDFYHVRWMGEK